jgi:hypothetical protein
MCGVLEGMHRVGWRQVPVVAVETVGAECFNLSQTAGELVKIYPTSLAKSLGASVATAQTGMRSTRSTPSWWMTTRQCQPRYVSRMTIECSSSQRAALRCQSCTTGSCWRGCRRRKVC